MKKQVGKASVSTAETVVGHIYDTDLLSSHSLTACDGMRDSFARAKNGINDNGHIMKTPLPSILHPMMVSAEATTISLVNS